MGFCSETKQADAKWFDPLGPNQRGVHAPTGGPEYRQELFDRMRQETSPEMQRATWQAAQATRDAAGDSGWGTMRQYATDAASGKYLEPNPALRRALDESRAASDARLAGAREQAMADLAGQQAAIRSQYARSGMGFSTANQQAQEAEQAALQARLARSEQEAAAAGRAAEAQTLANNYANERQLQQVGAAMIPGAVTGRANVLKEIPGMLAAPTIQEAEVLRGLSGGGQAITPTMYQKPGVADYMIAATGALTQGGL